MKIITLMWMLCSGKKLMKEGLAQVCKIMMVSCSEHNPYGMKTGLNARSLEAYAIRDGI